MCSCSYSKSIVKTIENWEKYDTLLHSFIHSFDSFAFILFDSTHISVSACITFDLDWSSLNSLDLFLKLYYIETNPDRILTRALALALRQKHIHLEKKKRVGEKRREGGEIILYS